MDKFYKLARPSGWDFYTGRTINYRDNIGKTVRRKRRGKVELCSNTCLHASRNPDDAFVGASIPCSVFVVEGVPIKEDARKAGFKQLHVIEELNPEDVFKWRYKEACNPINPFKIKPPEITDKHITVLVKWDEVWNSIGDRDAVWNSFFESIQATCRFMEARIGTKL